MKKILFFSGNRAEYSLIKPFILEFNKIGSKSKLIVSGSHLNKNLGNTIQEINKDKINIYKKIKIKENTNSLNNITKFNTKLQIEINKILKKNRFDYVFLSSDRFETLAVAIVSYINKIPIIHYEGGDITQGGSLDDNIRHAITKLSHIHLVSNENSKQNIIKLGENPKLIFNTGYSPLVNFNKKSLFSKKELFDFFKIKKNQKILLITMHPIAFDKKKTKKEIKNLIHALNLFLNDKYKIIFTYPNFDPNYKIIISEILKFEKKSNNIVVYPHLGKKLYHSLMYLIGYHKIGVCLGNSSSLVKEAPFFNCNTILIGDRQKGRHGTDAVYNIQSTSKEIFYTINKILKSSKKNNFKKNAYRPKKFKNILKKIMKLKFLDNFLLKQNFI